MQCARFPGIIFAGLTLSGAATAAVTPANCTVPADQVLHRLELELPGVTRVTRSVDIPAGTEVLVEASEQNVSARLEVRSPGATVAMAENALHRWAPTRLIIAKGAARKVDVTVIGIGRAHGTVEVRLSSLAAQPDPRCAQFWRAMADGDSAFTRADRIYRAEIDAPPGASEQAYETAVAAYARAARILGPGGFDEAQARLVHAYSLIYAVERYQEALEETRVARDRFEALGHERGRDLARFYWAWSMTYSAMHTTDPAEAKRKFEAARSAFVEVGASQLRRGERYDYAETLNGAAFVSGHLFRYADAIAGYQRALEVFEELNEADRAVGMRQNLAYFESQFGRYQEALKRHLAILQESDETRDSALYFANLVNTAFLELKLGQYDAALKHYSDAYAYSLRIQSPLDQGKALYGLGATYHAIGNFSEAQSYLERSLALRPQEQRPRDRANTLRTLANVLGDTGRGREAITRREEALRISQIPPEKARITLELIDDLIEAGDLATAKSLIDPLLGTRDAPDPAVPIGATLARARIALVEGDAARAERDAGTAADYYRSQQLVSAEFAALLVQARATCAAGARDVALEVARSALHRAEEIRTFSSNPTLRASLWRPLRPGFGFTIGLLARPDACGGSSPADALGALAIAEASRGRALEDFRLRSSTGNAARPQVNERRRELFGQLAGVRQQLETLSKSASAEDARVKILRPEAERLRREIDLTGGLPDSGRRHAEDLRSALAARIETIPKDTAVVEYWIGKDEAFAWLLTRGRVQLVDLGSAQRIDAAARSLHDAMHGWLTGSVEARIARARALHELVIAPLPAELARARTVYFIPDGTLHAVPFAALVSGDRDKPGFLVDSHDVAVAPAFLAVMPDAERRALRRDSTALVVVDPVYARDDGRFAGAMERGAAPLVAEATLRGSQAWSRLPATAREAETISKLLVPSAVRVLSGFDASRDSLLRSDLAKYDILHFATHAIADTEAPQLSALVLSTLDARGKPRIGEVFAGDLADQRLGAALVVLSGCETALGRAEAGEGLLGLRYAAHASGARTVVASLWPVMDAAGARLVDGLYSEVIGRSTSPVAALSRSMRNARSRWNDPALWAAFDVSVAGF